MRYYRQLIEKNGVVAQDEYVLYRLGSYDSKTMEVMGQEPVRVVVPPIMDDLRQPRLPLEAGGGDMNGLFKRVGAVSPGRSVFDLSYEKTFTADMGYLYPIMCDELYQATSLRLETRWL